MSFFRQTEDSYNDILKLIYNEANTGNNNKGINNPKVDAMNQTVFTNITYQGIPKELYYKQKEAVPKDNVQQRIKRHIKIRYASDEKTTKKTNETNTKDDELFVEIETHFNNKGLKGEKKKKFIRDLVDKIQKAIHNDTTQNGVKKKKRKKLHVRKRIQDPLVQKSKTVFINKLTIPFESMHRRRIEPISKSLPPSEPLPFVDNKSGENWRMKYTKSNFLSPSKAINSAELALLDTDYSRVLEVNGIPQRLQTPINTDGSEEIPRTYFDLGNLKFFVKDIADSGFSVGFNQYEDVAPDMETMKMFTGLENILQNYHQNYDFNNEPVENFENVIPDIEVPNMDHSVAKRSIHNRSNVYKRILDSDYIQYNNYKEMLNKKISNNEILKDIQTLVVSRNIFDKHVKPAEIFTLAKLFHIKRFLSKYHKNILKHKHLKTMLQHFHGRRKRSLVVKKISNVKNKIKLNKYLNTRPMIKKKIFVSKKRHKRQIGKIKIIASDFERNSRHSDEDIFVVSNEKILADRDIFRDVNDEVLPNLQPMIQQPRKANIETNDDYNIVSRDNDYDNVYTKGVRNNALMSKYPHIILEEIGRSKEFELPYNMVNIINNSTQQYPESPLGIDEVTGVNTISSVEMPTKVNDIVHAIAPKLNYKLTVKIIPKNGTNINSGYKETHTVINKSFDRDGKQYSSLVNVSEISKITKLNKTNELNPIEVTSQSTILNSIIETRNKMKYLLEQHKKRINAQLQLLNQEKEKFNSLLANNEANYTDSGLNLDYGTSTRVNLTEKINIPNLRSNVPQTELTQQVTDTQKFMETTTKMDSIRLLNSIQRNVNLTSEVLKKLDRNTKLLEQFLKKIINAVELTKLDTNKTTINVTKVQKEFKTHAIFQHDTTNPKVVNPAELFSKTSANFTASKNNTHLSIPFVYAYQKYKNNEEPTSIVYHGYFHTNNIHSKKDIENNQTKYFIDDFENLYTIPPLDKKKSFNNINGTI